MAIDFPNTPTNGQTFVANGITYKYDSSVGAWLIDSYTTIDYVVPALVQANAARDHANAAFLTANTGGNALPNVTTRATYSGNLDFTAGGISFGSRVSSASTNVMNHIALWSTTFGFSITEQNLNAVVPATSNVTILVGGTQRARVNSNGMWVEGGINATSMIKSTQLFANDMDVEPTVVAAFNKANNAVLNNTTTLITVGYNVATYNASANIAAFGTWQPNPSNGNYQVARCNGAVTIVTPPANSAIDILFINSVRRNGGAVTFSGYNVGTYTGTTYDTTANNRFILSIREIEGISTYSWYALQ